MQRQNLLKTLSLSGFVLLLLLTLAPLAVANTGNAPDFLLSDVTGRDYNSRAVIGKKPVLIIFSTTWCPACNGYLPDFKNIHRKYAPKGLEVVSINLGEPAGKVSAWVAKNAITYRVLIDDRSRVGAAYSISGVPGLVLIDKTGRIVCNPCMSFRPIENLLR